MAEKKYTGRSGAASKKGKQTTSSKPQAPPGQKVSGPHVFHGKKVGQKKPKKVTIGYGEGQVDPGLASAIFKQRYIHKLGKN